MQEENSIDLSLNKIQTFQKNVDLKGAFRYLIKKILLIFITIFAGIFITVVIINRPIPATIGMRPPQLDAKAHGDVILWFVYPKGTSKKYRADFNRDNGWDVIAAAGYQPVRMVAIDEDWSALRYRRSIYVKQ